MLTWTFITLNNAQSKKRWLLFQGSGVLIFEEKNFKGIFVDGHPCGEGELTNLRTGETSSGFFYNEYCRQEPTHGSRLHNLTFESDRHNYQTGNISNFA